MPHAGLERQRSGEFRLSVAGLLLALACAGGGLAAEGRRAPIEDVRGITVSCWRWGYEWNSPGMRELMATLPEVGANWLAIHPYAHVSRETGEVRWDPDDRVDHVEMPIRWARELGLRIMITPHLSYWGEFDWRGDIGWGDDEERWQRFRASYRLWILSLAQVAEREGADLFVVGSELAKTQGMESYWRELIRETRRVYRGPLTYAANWDSFESVPFWDALDLVGVQAYFPLSESLDPTYAELVASWQGPIARMTRLAERVGRPVVLVEVGYTNSERAASRPWEYHRGPGSSTIQARCLRAALDAVATAPALRGLFIWKWFPTTQTQGPGDFTVQTPEFKALIRQSWRRGVAGDSGASCIEAADGVPGSQ